MLLINKPIGITSFDVIKILRRELGIKKIGHAGTLDPLAEGLLIILVGKKETVLSTKFLSMPKTYETTAILGVKTDTGDLEGKITKSEKVNLSKSDIEKTLASLVGTFNWEVPIYSAIKVAGKPLYKYARSGADITLPKKEMTIYNISIKDIACNNTTCDVTYVANVSSGTYIRILNEKLGKRLNIPSTTKHIKRISIGNYDIKDAVYPDQATLDLMVPAL